MKAQDGPIFVPLDGSIEAQHVLPLAIYLARCLGHSLRLVRVLEPEQSGPGEVERAYQQLRELADSFDHPAPAIEVEVRIGDPVAELSRAAREGAARLIVLIGRRQTEGGRRGLGVIADRLVQRAPVPVLVQPAARSPRASVLPLDNGPILVPLDGSELAEMALADAVELARGMRRPLLILRANDLYAEPERREPPSPYVVNAIEEQTEGYLWSVADWLGRQGVPVETRSGWGPAARGIVAMADQEHAALICMATRGRGGLGRLALGHVADAVVVDVARPVLLVGPLAVEGRRSPMQVSEPTPAKVEASTKPVAGRAR